MRPSASAAFLSTPRTFHWNDYPQPPAVTAELSGKLTRYSHEKSNWDGLNLDSRKPDNASVPRVEQRWKEYSEARRTIEHPSPASVPRYHSQAAVSNLTDLISQKASVEDLGNSKKA
jgi:hypothetical protein